MCIFLTREYCSANRDTSITSYRNLLLKNSDAGKKLRDQDNPPPTIRNLLFEGEDNSNSHLHANFIYFVKICIP